MANKISSKDSLILLISVTIVGFCTIVYELLIGGVSSYFLGDSIKQFSVVIGLTMTAMGLGTLLSRFINKNLIYYFVIIEILLAITGGLSVPLLYYVYMIEPLYYPTMCLLILIIGILIGMEIPILTRIMEQYYNLKDNISNVLSLDYLGAFVATLAFPFFLLPVFGVFNTSIIAGLLNLIVGLINFYHFKEKLSVNKSKKIMASSVVILLTLVFSLIFSKALMKFWENNIYEDHVIFSKQTKYQKLIITRNKDDIRLFIDGNVQFSSIDEYRYHEALIHIPFAQTSKKENVLILGGGDGLAVREILKHKEVKNIVLVDLDKEMTNLGEKNPIFVKLNEGSLKDNRVQILNEDAFKFLENTKNTFDVIIIDLPDPNNSSLARLYSKEFYKLAKKKLAKRGVLVTQATSPFFAPEAFWCINETMKAAGFENVLPYHIYVPAFGDWGFVMAGGIPFKKEVKIIEETKFLDNESAKNAFNIEKDLVRKGILPSSLDKPNILNYYLQGWRHWE